MTKVVVRLARLAAAVPTPVPAPAYDLSRLTADQLSRMADLRGRVDAVGLAGLTDGEVEELAEMSEILLASDSPGRHRVVRALGRRVVAVRRVVTPEPDRTVLAYARAVVAYGGGDPAREAAVGLTRWLERRGKDGGCGPG